MVVDTETGSFQCERADIIMDVGETLNAAIDIGQARQNLFPNPNPTHLSRIEPNPKLYLWGRLRAPS